VWCFYWVQGTFHDWRLQNLNRQIASVICDGKKHCAQYIVNAGGDKTVSDAVVLGVRAQMNF